MGRVALVLHAHLPWVRAREPWSATERWFHEALWECYLPLLALLERARARVTLSLSPPLAAMLRDPLLRRRSRDHLAALASCNEALAPSAALREHYAALLAAADARGDEDVVAAWRRCAGVELVTTAATHAFLPGLAPVGGARAQLTIGRALMAGVASDAATWLPECGIDDSVDAALGAVTTAATVVDSHAALLAAPPVGGPAFTSPHGVVCVARHRDACLRVWSRRDGYPGHPLYREFFRDAGHDAPPERLGPFRHGSMIGLKYHRITGSEDKALYDPAAAQALAPRDAAEYAALLAERARAEELVVLAFDAELFGHWWHEGPLFLEALLARLAEAGVDTVTLGELAAQRWPTAQPAPSSWGREGYFRDWINAATAPFWRPIHHVHRSVARAARSAVGGARGAALDYAIGELMLLEASDWLYMIGSGEHAAYASARLARHRRRCERMLAIAAGAPPARGDAERLEQRHPLTGALSSESLRRAVATT
jgi:1,4-alpha-glucan branching enzyme